MVITPPWWRARLLLWVALGFPLAPGLAGAQAFPSKPLRLVGSVAGHSVVDFVVIRHALVDGVAIVERIAAACGDSVAPHRWSFRRCGAD